MSDDNVQPPTQQTATPPAPTQQPPADSGQQRPPVVVQHNPQDMATLRHQLGEVVTQLAALPEQLVNGLREANPPATPPTPTTAPPATTTTPTPPATQQPTNEPSKKVSMREKFQRGWFGIQ